MSHMNIHPFFEDTDCRLQIILQYNRILFYSFSLNSSWDPIF